MQRPPAKSFRDLEVWQKAHEFVLGVYRLTARLLAAYSRSLLTPVS